MYVTNRAMMETHRKCAEVHAKVLPQHAHAHRGYDGAGTRQTLKEVGKEGATKVCYMSRRARGKDNEQRWPKRCVEPCRVQVGYKPTPNNAR